MPALPVASSLIYLIFSSIIFLMTFGIMVMMSTSILGAFYSTIDSVMGNFFVIVEPYVDGRPNPDYPPDRDRTKDGPQCYGRDLATGRAVDTTWCETYLQIKTTGSWLVLMIMSIGIVLFILKLVMVATARGRD